MGHFSVEIYAPPGSALSENQQSDAFILRLGEFFFELKLFRRKQAVLPSELLAGWRIPSA